jgi:protein-L-isoaspartate O-methyltransferase
MASAYVHGYDLKESLRLQDQANSLVDLLHSDTHYPAGARVLEAGCGVGAQTVTLAKNSPTASIVSIDVADTSLALARKAVAAAGITNVEFRKADLFARPFPDAAFDHVFVCFVLEHLSRPEAALQALKQMLKPGGTLTVIEGDHGSAYYHPQSALAQRAIQCLIDLQARPGGDSLIGRRLFPLIAAAGFEGVSVSPRMVYVDSSKPRLVEGFTKKTFTAMVEGVRAPAIAAGLMTPADFDRGIADLYRTAEDDGVFCYTFFKAVAHLPGSVPVPVHELAGEPRRR